MIIELSLIYCQLGFSGTLRVRLERRRPRLLRRALSAALTSHPDGSERIYAFRVRHDTDVSRIASYRQPFCCL